MRKALKKASIVALSGALCLSSFSFAYAATKTKTGGGVLKEYNAELSEQRTELAELIQSSKALTKTIVTAQKEAKEEKRINKTASDKLAELSTSIKAKRIELTEARTDSKSLRSAAKEARTSGDFDLAAEKLTKLADLQDEQISIRKDLVELLEKKLDYLNGLEVNTDTTTEETTKATESTETAVEATETTTDTTEATDATETTEAAAESETVDTSIPSDAEIDAALDDGAELEEELSVEDLL